jgi:catechol 2,3-dioxygenase-like lactoylglutathione lyase family enzyme
VLGAQCEREPYRIGGEIMVRQIRIGKAALSLHRNSNGIALVAAAASPGVLDVCFRWTGTVNAAVAHLQAKGVEIVEGPIKRSSAAGQPAQSVYFRDPDGNSIELLAIAD